MAVEISGQLTMPDQARGVVLFAHGSGSGSRSPRNRYVAGVLQRGGAGHAAVRPADAGGGSVTGPTCSTSDCWPGGCSRRRSGYGEEPADGGPADRLLRRQHRRRGRAVGGGRAGRGRRRGRLPGRAARPGRGTPGGRTSAHAADRRRPRRAGGGAQPGGAAAAALRESAGDRAGGHPPVRGAGRAGQRRRARPRLVHRAPLNSCTAAGLQVYSSMSSSNPAWKRSTYALLVLPPMRS